MVYSKVVLMISIAVSLFGFDIKDIDTYEANFKQVVKKSKDNQIMYSGKVYIKKPSNILWQYKKPVIKNVFINGSFAIVDEPELEQAIYSSLDKEMNFLDIFENAKKIDKENYIATLNHREYKLHIEDNLIKEIEYTDEVENSIKIYFDDIKKNLPIDNSVFDFKAPENYDIIRK